MTMQCSLKLHTISIFHAQLLWRYARTLYEVSGNSSASSTTRLSGVPPLIDDSEEKQLLEKALVSADRSIEASEETRDEGELAKAHLWYAIVLEALGRWKSLREKIADSFVIKGE